jgi:hypothetical protein
MLLSIVVAVFAKKHAAEDAHIAALPRYLSLPHLLRSSSVYSTSESIIIIISLLRNDAMRKCSKPIAPSIHFIHSNFLDLLAFASRKFSVCLFFFRQPSYTRASEKPATKTKKNCYLVFNDVREMMKKKYQKRSGFSVGWSVNRFGSSLKVNEVEEEKNEKWLSKKALGERLPQ